MLQNNTILNVDLQCRHYCDDSRDERIRKSHAAGPEINKISFNLISRPGRGCKSAWGDFRKVSPPAAAEPHWIKVVIYLWYRSHVWCIKHDLYTHTREPFAGRNKEGKEVRFFPVCVGVC